MRLLNSSTLLLEDFPADQIPAYAIFSHTWEEGEVLLADMERCSAEDKAGYKKIRYSCAQAAAHGLHYIWVDTCCIDKSSSAELSEAINSMYSWYQKAEICYAYLADVPANVDTGTIDSAFAKSRWFKRGWTLQELIGPSNLVFFSDDWVEVGKKSSLCSVLAKITGIDVGILTGVTDLESASVAKRMSWASHRATTRVEDIAYCLMGLFAVNMPMLYGEGEKAFIRLQEEIMKHSDDQSLFAWVDSTAPPDSYHGLLAKSPTDFVNSGNIIPYRDWEPRTPFTISNKGLCIDLHLIRSEEDIYVAALDCPAPPDYEGFLGIYLKRLSTGDHQYARVKPQTLCILSGRGSIETVYVRQSIMVPGPRDVYPQHTFQLRKGPAREDGYELIDVISSVSSKNAPAPIWPSRARSWIPSRMPFTFKIPKGASRLAGALFLERNDGKRLLIMLGSTTDFGVAFDVAAVSEIESFEELERSFCPQAPGTLMVLENHQVRVNAESQIHSGVKYYMVDVVVEAVYKPQNPIHMIIPLLQSQSDERPPNAIVDHSRSFWKLKAPFKSSRIQKSLGP